MTPLEKDYYRILNVPASATNEQIKDQYRKLAKKYHPDARIAGKYLKLSILQDKTVDHTPNADLFRDVVEAYQVLSVRESRVNYDLQRRKNPDLFKGMSEFEFNLEHRRDLRDKRGQIQPAEKPSKDSYAHDRMQQLKVERGKYNVNHIGYYQGGVPKKGAGPRRGNAIGNVGEFHSPQIHNFLEHNH